MLDHFGEFPEKYRLLTWKHLLHLPLNYSAFETLVQKGVHPAFRKLNQAYKGKKLARVEKVLSALANWCPLIAHLDFLTTITSTLVDLI